MINSLLGTHSLREPNTCNHGIYKLQVLQVFNESQPLTSQYFSSLNDRSRTAWKKKSQNFVPEITVLSYSNPGGSSKVFSYQLLLSVRRKRKRWAPRSQQSCCQQTRAGGRNVPDTGVPQLTKSCHSPSM